MEVDEDIRNTLSRLLDETIDGQRALEAKVDSNTDRILTILDVHSKQLDSLTAEHYSMRGA
jgi:copper homeostasis protein CutC